jgi:hypothetical protein
MSEQSANNPELAALRFLIAVLDTIELPDSAQNAPVIIPNQRQKLRQITLAELELVVKLAIDDRERIDQLETMLRVRENEIEGLKDALSQIDEAAREIIWRLEPSDAITQAALSHVRRIARDALPNPAA